MRYFREKETGRGKNRLIREDMVKSYEELENYVVKAVVNAGISISASWF